MTARSMWKGALTIGLVTAPVSAYKATDDREGLSLRQLCPQDLTPISQNKNCSVHGVIASVVKGYESAPGVFVVINDDELDALAIESNRVLEINQFVPAGSVQFAKADYYLGTDKVGAAAYVLIRDTMREENVEAVTTVTFRGREHLATIRATETGLVLTTHYWPDEVRDAGDLVPDVAPRPQAEKDIARQLIASMTGPFISSDYKDMATAALVSLINDKIAGIKPSKRAAKPAVSVPDLTAAIAASLAAQKKKRGAA